MRAVELLGKSRRPSHHTDNCLPYRIEGGVAVVVVATEEGALVVVVVSLCELQRRRSCSLLLAKNLLLVVVRPSPRFVVRTLERNQSIRQSMERMEHRFLLHRCFRQIGQKKVLFVDPHSLLGDENDHDPICNAGVLARSTVDRSVEPAFHSNDNRGSHTRL